MSNFIKEIAKCKHPNSRKTKALTKKSKRETHKQEAKLGQMIKQNIIGEKIKWFQVNLPEDKPVYTKRDVYDLLTKYIQRFDEELSQIEIKNTVGIRKNRQHASREGIIKMTQKTELEEHQSCGLLIPDLMDAEQVIMLKEWNGELKYIQNFKLRRFPKSMFLNCL